MTDSDDDSRTSVSGSRTRKTIPLRLDPRIHAALSRWAADDLRSLNGQIDYLLRQALRDAGRLPDSVAAPRRPGRPPLYAADAEHEIPRHDHGTGRVPPADP